MKIIGFSQLRNELEKGNLHNWFKSMNEVCDKIYIFDQASDDGSQQVYREEGGDKVRVLQNTSNNFSNEIGCKSVLLKHLLENDPDVDWIFWMDGDTILDVRLSDYNKIREVLEKYEDSDVGSLMLGHYNLWRSDTLYRTDDQYHGLHGGVVALWKNNQRLFFPDSGGLHQMVTPVGLGKSERIDVKSDTLYSLIHKGFSTDYQIIKKYEVYKARGQKGWALDRLLKEEGLTVEEIPQEILPDWYTIRNENDPLIKEELLTLYKRLKGLI